MADVLVLGGSGMLGHKMFDVLGRRFDDVRCTVRSHKTDPPIAGADLLQSSRVTDGVDVTDFAALERLVLDLDPDVIVNCVGVVKQRPAATDPLTSIAVNSLLPHQLARLSAAIDARLIHFSTDCVFSGERGNYSEEDPSDARDLYGRSKFLGEVTDGGALTLRTSMVGREFVHFESLLEWFLARDGETVSGYRRMRFSGLSTIRLAHLVGDLIEYHPDLSGLYHVAGPPISKYELLVLFRDAFDVKIAIEPDDDQALDRTLDDRRFRQATGFAPPPWTEIVAEMAADPTPYEEWRR